jgi:peptidoglycan LD-endopeptidase LytH
MRSTLLLLAVIALMASCTGLSTLKDNLASASPYERYVRNLESANLKGRPMVREWIDAGERALHDSIMITLPFTETGHFLSHRPEARSYQFDALDGQVITINGALKVTEDAKFFADLFVLRDHKWKHVASSDSSLTLSHEFTRNSRCLLRIQPELLVNAYYTISVGLTPILINPVSGANNKSIQSFWGDSRDGGRRKHEGVDIFAKKGTPIVAPTGGTISRVGYSKLGGKVVWMYDQKRGHSYYFAHLDSQYVTRGKLVKQGQVIGTVGNTGNAKNTPAHLHFGIYQAKAKDPLYYIKTLEQLESTLAVDTSFRFLPFTIMSKNATIRKGPGEKFATLGTFDKGTYLHVIAQSRDWYRIALPDNQQGFVIKKDVAATGKGSPSILDRPRELLTTVTNRGTVVRMLTKAANVEMIGKFDNYLRIRTLDGLEGWIEN